MSYVTDCDIGVLTLDDIMRLVSGIDGDGNYFIRVYNDGTDASSLSDIDCDDHGVSALDIFRGALVTNPDGEYALNIVSV